MLSRRALGTAILLIFIPFALAFSQIRYVGVEDHLYTFTSKLNGDGVRVFNPTIFQLTYFKLFLSLFIFRYTRTIVNTLAYLVYKPTALSVSSFFSNTDVTVIVTTIDPYRVTFSRTISNILVNKLAKVIVALAGKDIDWKPLADCLCYRNVEVVRLSGIPSKRKQMMAALTKVKTPLVAFIDDRVYVPPTFLQYMLPPLSTPSIGVVTPAVLTQRFNHGLFSFAGFWNFIGCLYILRRNFDRQAINTIDGGISTVPGRAFLIRSEIMKDPDYIHTFLNEYMNFPIIGRIGPVNAGEDTFTTRWLYRKGWKIAVQHCAEATVETDNLGVWPRFKDQLSRWSRSSIRSRLTQTAEGWSYIRRYSWTFYAVNVQSLTNFPLFVDWALVLTLYKGLAERESDALIGTKTAVILFLVWLLSSKMVKLVPHFKRYPGDLLYFPFYVLFVYYHTFHRIYAVATLGNDSWAGRVNLNDVHMDKDARCANIRYEDGKFYDIEESGGGGMRDD